MSTTVAGDVRAKEYEELLDDEPTVRAKVAQLARLVRQHAGRVVVVTGAGISTGAGVPDFRSGLGSVTGLPAGKWCKQATEGQWSAAEAADERSRRAKAVPTTRAVPSQSHMALVGLQRAGILRGVISQNTDGLHRRSGFPPEALAELHGNSTMEYCGWCGKEYLRDYAASQGRRLSGPALKRRYWHEHSKLQLRNPRSGNHYTGRRCQVEGCEGWLFDSTIDFGDDLPDDHFERGEALAREATLCIVLGSRCSVSPACSLPISVGKSKQRIDGNQKTLVVVNLQRTHADFCASLRIGAKIDEVMVPLMAALARDIDSIPASIEPFVLRRRIRVRHTTALALQRQSLEALDGEQDSAKRIAVVIGKCLGMRGASKVAPVAVLKTARAQLNLKLESHGGAVLQAGEVKAGLLKCRDALLAQAGVERGSGKLSHGSGRLEVNAVDSDGLAADVLWYVKALLLPSETAAAPDSGAAAALAPPMGGDLHVELTRDIRPKGGGRGAQGRGKGPAPPSLAGLGGAARGSVARVLSYPWENSVEHEGDGDCGYGRVVLELTSGAAPSSSSCGQGRGGGGGRCLTVGADMCAVLGGSASSGVGTGAELTHTIHLSSLMRAERPEQVAHDLGVLLCFRSHYGEPPLVLPLPGGSGSAEGWQSYLLEWRPGQGTGWRVTGPHHM